MAMCFTEYDGVPQALAAACRYTYNPCMEHLPEPLPDDPLGIVADWLAAARDDGGFPNPDAMALATGGGDLQPAVRVVLCKTLVAEPGYLIFYTNYASAKAAAMETDARVAGVFHWDHMDRQVRIEGRAERSPEHESDAYFASRDRTSQLGAWASAQSEPIADRAALQRAMKAIEVRFPAGEPVPRPPHWGGYRIWLSAVELWARGRARLHDRARWERELGKPLSGGGYLPGLWSGQRLQP